MSYGYAYSYGYSDGTYEKTDAFGSYTPKIFEVSDYQDSTVKYTCTAVVIKTWIYSTVSGANYNVVMLRGEDSTAGLMSDVWGDKDASAGLLISTCSPDGTGIAYNCMMSGAYDDSYDAILFDNIIDGNAIFTSNDLNQTISLKFQFY